MVPGQHWEACGLRQTLLLIRRVHPPPTVLQAQEGFLPWQAGLHWLPDRLAALAAGVPCRRLWIFWLPCEAAIWLLEPPSDTLAALKAETGFRTSAGVACNRLLAKLVSGLHKPDDQTVLCPPDAPAFVAPLPVRALPGIGYKTDGELQASAGACIGQCGAVWLTQ